MDHSLLKYNKVQSNCVHKVYFKHLNVLIYYPRQGIRGGHKFYQTR